MNNFTRNERELSNIWKIDLVILNYLQIHRTIVMERIEAQDPEDRKAIQFANCCIRQRFTPPDSCFQSQPRVNGFMPTDESQRYKLIRAQPSRPAATSSESSSNENRARSIPTVRQSRPLAPVLASSALIQLLEGLPRRSRERERFEARTTLAATSSRSVLGASAASYRNTILINDDSADEVQLVQPTTSASSKANDSTMNIHKVDHTCKICETHEIQSVCLPCGHFCVCQACYDRMPKLPRLKCPICRAPVTSYIRVFFWAWLWSFRLHKYEIRMSSEYFSIKISPIIIQSNNLAVNVPIFFIFLPWFVVLNKDSELEKVLVLFHESTKFSSLSTCCKTKCLL